MTVVRTRYTLMDLCELITDGAHSSPKFEPNGSKIIATVKDMGEFNFKLSQCKKISEEDFKSLKRNNCVPQMGDVLFSKDGTIGKVIHYNTNFELALLSSIAIFRPNNKIIDSRFLSYYLKSTTNNKFIKENFRSGSAIPRIILRDFKKFELFIPPLPEQEAIASIITSIEDKIELNLQMNKTLEEMAMTLYKHWFVDFGPFQDGKFVDSELGMIPEGWEVQRLEGLVFKLSKGTTPTKKMVDGKNNEIHFLKVKDITSDGTIKYNELSKIPKDVHLKNLKRSILQTNDILISIAGSIGRTSIVPKNLDNSNCNQALAFIRAKNIEYVPFIYCYLNSISTQNFINQSVVQGVQANVSLGVLKGMSIIIPDKSNFTKFSDLINPLVTKQQAIRDQNLLLVRTRNTLLPNLISGKIRLKEFQKEVSKAL